MANESTFPKIQSFPKDNENGTGTSNDLSDGRANIEREIKPLNFYKNSSAVRSEREKIVPQPNGKYSSPMV